MLEREEEPGVGWGGVGGLGSVAREHSSDGGWGLTGIAAWMPGRAHWECFH